MARAAVPRRLGRPLTWRPAALAARRAETPTARTLVLDVPGWPGHLAGQHVDLRLTADDGYQAVRSYSLAAPADGDLIELTVQGVLDGEVSAYLTETFQVGDAIELRGPAGGWFVWRPTDPAPVLLVAGGAGIVPLMAMVRARRAARSAAPFRLVYSVRGPDQLFYADELGPLVAGSDAEPDADADADANAGVDVDVVFTRGAPPGTARPPGRIDAEDLAAPGWSADRTPSCFVCGPTGFVERAADLLVELGHDPRRIKTERFGPAGG